MGLDMYFMAEKQKYVSWFDEKFEYPQNLQDFQEMADYPSKIMTEQYEIGYFRKFNALHSYIVQNFNDGVDDCKDIYLSKDNVQELYNVCSSVLINQEEAEKLLPTESGFFFGSTEYDSFYFEYVKEATKLFKTILDKIDFSEYRIVYSASW